MATQGYPLLVLYCPYCREGSEAAVASSQACPRCGRPRMRFSGANWASRSGEPYPVAEMNAPHDGVAQVRYKPTKRPAAVEQTLRNVQFGSMR